MNSAKPTQQIIDVFLQRYSLVAVLFSSSKNTSYRDTKGKIIEEITAHNENSI